MASLEFFIDIILPITLWPTVLCYKSESRWFDSRWCHWNFSLT